MAFTDRKPPTKAEREDKMERARKLAEQNMDALRKSNDSFQSNFERLKAERREREKNNA